MPPRSTPAPDVHSVEAQSQRVLLSSFRSGAHRDTFTRALRNVLSAEISETTLAQIVDELPLSAVERDTYPGHGYLCGSHPLHKKHKELCPGVLDRTRRLYTDFDVDALRISSHLLHEYKISAPGSRAFQMRLIELVAVIIHQIAVQLFYTEGSLHKDDGIASWEPPKELRHFWLRNPDGPPPTLFQHRQYRYYDQSPDGIADGVGYWAESRIFGGVVLFDRRESGSADDVDPEGVYLHPERANMTYRICRLLDSQKLALLHFLPSEDTTTMVSPLPSLVDQKNTRRVDPEEPAETTGVYRDVWERRPLEMGELDRRLKDVIDTIDFPTDEDLDKAQERGALMREGHDLEKYGV